MTSGITQELIAIVVLAVAAIVYLVYLRRDEGVPAWLVVLSIALAAVLVVVMAHSYMMSARPAWDPVLWIFYVLGNACAGAGHGGPRVRHREGAGAAGGHGGPDRRGRERGEFTIVYAVTLQFLRLVHYGGLLFRPHHAHRAFGGRDGRGQCVHRWLAPLMWIGVILVGAVVPLIAALLEKRSGATPAADGTAVASRAELWMAVAVIAAVIGAICMRVVFYELGASVFMLY